MVQSVPKMTTLKEGSPRTISSTDRAIRGTVSHQRVLREPGVLAPNILVSGINRKISQLIEGGANVLESNDGMAATLEAPVSIFSYPRIPRELRDIVKVNAQDRMKVRILSRGYWTDYAYVNPFVAIDFTVFPNVRTEAPIRIRISQSGMEIPTITVRERTMPPKEIPYDPYILRFFLRTVDRAKQNWGGIEDYIVDLKELARGKMSAEGFAKLEDDLRFSAEMLDEQKRVSGEPAIEHSYRAVRDAMLAGVFDEIDLSTIVLHDNWEDAPELKQRGIFSVWHKKTKADITARFGEEKARRLMALTKPRPDPEPRLDPEKIEIATQEEGDEMAVRSLLAYPPAAFDKIFDLSDNVETLDVMSVENQIKTLRKTIVYIRRIFMDKRVRAVNPRAWRISMNRLVTAMEPLCARHRIEIPPDILVLKG